MNLQLITLILFFIFGGIAFCFRLRYDINQGALQYGKKIDDATRRKAGKSFRFQLIFSLLSVFFLTVSIILGIIKVNH